MQKVFQRLWLTYCTHEKRNQTDFQSNRLNWIESDLSIESMNQALRGNPKNIQENIGQYGIPLQTSEALQQLDAIHRRFSGVLLPRFSQDTLL